MGTRVSARLRAEVAEEEWQPVPKEWMTGSENPEGKVGHGKPPDSLPKTGLESDDEAISDLTELTDDSDTSDVDRHSSARPDEREMSSDRAESPSPPTDFIEWETVKILVFLTT
jgi:hypothetical protein